MKRKTFVTPHCHPNSLDSGSLWDSWVRRELELESGSLTVTDHGLLSGCKTAYKLAKKNNLIPILGIEAYFRPTSCDIFNKFNINKDDDGTYKSFLKYQHVTMHHLDEEAYYASSRILSKRYETAEKHGSELKPIYDWGDLEELSNYNITIGSSCLIGMVSRFILQYNNFEMAEAYYQKLRSLRPNNFFVEIFPHICDSNFDSAVYLTLLDGTEKRLPSWKKTKSSLGELTAKELSRKRIPEDFVIEATMENRKWVECHLLVSKVEFREGELKNECTPTVPDGDIQNTCNKFLLHLATKYKDPILVSGDEHIAYPEEKIAQDIKLQADGSGWRFVTSYHRKTNEEAFTLFKQKLGIDEKTFEGWVENSYDFRDRFKDFKFNDKLRLPSKFYPSNTIGHLKKLIDETGRMDWNDEKKLKRLQEEVQIIHNNGKVDFLPYFFLVKEALQEVEKAGELTSPGRGSSGSLLLSYVLGITHINPLEYNLPKERFLTLDRIHSGKLPDIDLDIANRELLVHPETGWLKRRFGDNYAQVSTVTTLKLRNTALDVARVLCGGEVPENIRYLTSNFRNADQGVTDLKHVFGYTDDTGAEVQGSIHWDASLIEYTQKYPKHWEIVQKLLGIQRSLGRHPSAFIVASDPISGFIPTTKISGITATQYTAADCEAAGAIKMDFLGLTSLNDLSTCLKILRDRHPIPENGMKFGNEFVPFSRLLSFNGQIYDIWNLPEDQKVYNEICSGNNSTVFQLDTPGANQWMKRFNVVIGKKNDEDIKIIQSIQTLSTFLALDRRGPLDSSIPGTKHNVLVEYTERVQGRFNGTRIPILEKLLPETYALCIFQENIASVFKEIGETTGSEAEDFRVHTSKKMPMEIAKDRAVFMPKAIQKMGKELAEQVWGLLNTFSGYGFCIDSEQEILTLNGYKKVFKITTNDLVASLSDENKVIYESPTDVWCSGEKEVLEVELEDGSTIRATGDHKFLYNNEWVELNDLILIGEMESQPIKYEKQASSIV